MRPVLDYENGHSLFRRSNPHSPSDHFNFARLGELSTNWSKICSNKELVRIEPFGTNSLYSVKATKVLVFDSSKYSEDEIPECVIRDSQGNSLRVAIKHSPLKANYSHCDVDCYLTTVDGVYTDSLVGHNGYNEHPLKKKLKGLRNEYRTKLAYWFQFEDEEDGKGNVIEVTLEPPLDN